jgi:hypothetical protein
MPAIERPAMTDYGVPTEPAGALDWSWGRDRMVASRNYWVVTVSGSGEPFATPVWGVWLDDPEGFWFGCSPNAAKVRHLATNPRVTVMADSTVEVVSVHGIGTSVRTNRAAVEAMLPKYWKPEEFEVSREFLAANAMVHVRPTRAYAIIETEEDFSAKATRWVW